MRKKVHSNVLFVVIWCCCCCYCGLGARTNCNYKMVLLLHPYGRQLMEFVNYEKSTSLSDFTNVWLICMEMLLSFYDWGGMRFSEKIIFNWSLLVFKHLQCYFRINGNHLFQLFLFAVNTMFSGQPIVMGICLLLFVISFFFFFDTNENIAQYYSLY